MLTVRICSNELVYARQPLTHSMTKLIFMRLITSQQTSFFSTYLKLQMKLNTRWFTMCAPCVAPVPLQNHFLHKLHRTTHDVFEIPQYRHACSGNASCSHNCLKLESKTYPKYGGAKILAKPYISTTDSTKAVESTKLVGRSKGLYCESMRLHWKNKNCFKSPILKTDK